MTEMLAESPAISCPRRLIDRCINLFMSTGQAESGLNGLDYGR
jgi:hypothetical protein